MKRILIVEDNLANMKLYHMLLRPMQLELIEASNGKEGVNQANTTNPNLILMDIQLPIMDGIEAFHIIRSNPQTRIIPIIAVTSYAMKGDEERLLSMGFDAYMSKPLSKVQFLTLIQRFL